MRVSVVRPAELGVSEVSAWHAMQDKTGELRNPFLSPEFAVAVGQARAEHGLDDVRVALLSDGSGLAGFFPFQRGRLGAGQPVGAGLSDCQGLVYAPGATWDASELLKSCGISVWHFDHLVSGQEPFSRYQVATAPSPVIDLKDGYAAYEDKVLSAKTHFRKELSRKSRKLDREVGQVKFVLDSPDPADLRALINWKSGQYQRTGRADTFDEPWVITAVERLLACRENGFRALLSMLYAGARPVASIIGLENAGVIAGWFTSYDPELSRYSPGLVHLLAMVKDVADLGISQIDLGKGDKYYKEALKSRDVTVGEGMVTSGSALAAFHRARLAPPRWAVRQIRAHRPLYEAADKVLRYYGRAKVAVHGRRLS
ncbi:MAG TPA: GNAT family N-acetyltransferase [Streptosporangiaceae bacterium]|nr:GNAT family N-acetyltransferase [Streptosporangiaceae bacterium]